MDGLKALRKAAFGVIAGMAILGSAGIAEAQERRIPHSNRGDVTHDFRNPEGSRRGSFTLNPSGVGRQIRGHDVSTRRGSFAAGQAPVIFNPRIPQFNVSWYGSGFWHGFYGQYPYAYDGLAPFYGRRYPHGYAGNYSPPFSVLVQDCPEQEMAVEYPGRQDVAVPADPLEMATNYVHELWMAGRIKHYRVQEDRLQEDADIVVTLTDGREVPINYIGGSMPKKYNAPVIDISRYRDASSIQKAIDSGLR